MTALFDLDNPTPATRRDPSTPAWVIAFETRTGATATLAGGRAIPRPCSSCRAWTLTGYDAPLIADTATVDPYAATPLQEAAALILAVATYQLWGTPGRYHLTPRHLPGLRILGHHPPATHVTVVIAHTCRPPLATQPLPALRPSPRYDGPPPF
ncbi:hypothetical protein ACFWGN_20800 [Oerskovia sp. NPDC060338]|uniref:hypothetical protein n=1 Tax=Oerskovia sp. NPDC060338 TaxID=3347100 RepID=UPI00365B9467